MRWCLMCVLAIAALGPACVGQFDPGELPAVQYTAPVNAFVGQTIVFDASASSDPEGPLSAYSFDFGDGSRVLRSASPRVEHAYAQAGTFLTRISVIDEIGNKFTELREIAIVSRDEVPTLVCQAQRPFCPPYYVCDTESLLCAPDIDGDGISSMLDEDEPACGSDSECPGELRCEGALCVF